MLSVPFCMALDVTSLLLHSNVKQSPEPVALP